jgi:hypothetical protein
MRKLIAVLALAALVGAPAALAKERNVKMLGPVAPKAGQAWNATISVKMDGKLAQGRAPVVRIMSTTGRTINVPSRSTTKTGIYRVQVVFPSAGTWRVIVVDRETGRAYEFNRMKVRAA